MKYSAVLCLLSSVLWFASGCTHVPPGGAGEWHTSFGIPGMFKVSTDNTGIKVTEKKIVAATHEDTVSILLFEMKNTGKDVVLPNPK